VIGEEGRVPDELPSQIDRSFQRSLLLWMRDEYPSMAYKVPTSLDGNDRRFYFNLFYLQEHGLCEALAEKNLDGSISWGGAKITAKGVDFLENDGVIDKKATQAGAIMTTPTRSEWMSAHETIQFLELPHTDAASAICSRAYAGLIKARAKLFISFGEEKTNFEVPRKFWWAKGEAGLEQNWVLGDFETWVKEIDREHGGRREGLQQAFGVTFRRLDIEQLRPATAPASCRKEAIITTPTDREWMSAQEALDYLGLGFAQGAYAICAHASAGLVQAKARRFLVHGAPDDDDVELPREFWSRSDEAQWHDWPMGHFKTAFNDGHFEAFGVQFRRSDIERLKPASKTGASAPAASTAPSQTTPPTVFIGHGGRSSEWLKLEKFLSTRLHLSAVEFNSIEVAGRATSDRLVEMLKQADFAFLILTGEDERATGEVHPRLNVVHEAGLFQGKLGFEKAIILLEEGCEKFSNVHGLNDIRFPKGKIETAFEKVRGVLEREGLI
jgi:predicted nucleotide-binding protein